MAAGDLNWSNLLTSIQTDEARHARQGFPTLQVLMAHDPERGQQIMDVALWRATRLFQILTGPATPAISAPGSGGRPCSGNPVPGFPGRSGSG